MSLLLTRGDRSYLVSPGERLETDLGVIEVPPDAEAPATLESHLGERFALVRPRSTDLFDHLERAGAPMIPRDVGVLVGLTGLGAGDRVLDVGAGSAVLAVTLGRLGVAVTTYERDAETAATAVRNVERAGVSSHVTVVAGDATAADLDGGYDGLTLDTGDAPELAERAADVLAPGGVLAAYAPFVERARAVAEAAGAAGLEAVETHETIHRTMDFDRRGSRPSTAPVGHTGYLTVGRHLPRED
ncbi:MAG: 50S ribosomal protein L11 methyltransferase [Halobacteriales archaeon]